MVPLIKSRKIKKKHVFLEEQIFAKNIITAIVIANKKNDERFGNATEWYRHLRDSKVPSWNFDQRNVKSLNLATVRCQNLRKARLNLFSQCAFASFD